MTSLFLAQNVQNNKQMDSPTPSLLPALFLFFLPLIWSWSSGTLCLQQVRWSKPKRMVLETTHTQFRFTEQLKMNKNTIFTISSELLQHAIYIFIQSLLFHRTPCRKRIRRSNQLRLMRHPKYGTAFHSFVFKPALLYF